MNNVGNHAAVPIRCTMVSVAALRGQAVETRVLLLKRAGTYLHGAWSYVAGHVEAGEAGWQTALRELAEETGITPRALYSSGFAEQFYNARGDCIEIVPGFVAIVDDGAEVRLNDEHSAFRWLSFDRALTALPFGSQRDLFAHVRREFTERDPPAHLRIPMP